MSTKFYYILTYGLWSQIRLIRQINFDTSLKRKLGVLELVGQ